MKLNDDGAKVDTYLVQRLTPSPKTELAAMGSKAFAFGGGGSGFSEEAWDLIHSVFDFHYMGAAEFEFGAIPRKIQNMIVDKEHFLCWDFVIKAKYIKPNYDRTRHPDVLRRNEIYTAKQKGEKPPRLNQKKLIAQAGQSPITDKTVYILGDGRYKEQITDMIFRMGTSKHYQTKNGHNFDSALDNISKYNRETIGWFDIENGVVWFLDKDRRDKLAYLFGMKSDYKPTEESPPTAAMEVKSAEVTST